MDGVGVLLKASAARAQHKADHAELADALRTARHAEDRAAEVERKAKEDGAALRDQMTGLANSTLSGGGIANAGNNAVASTVSSPVDDEELERLWGAIEGKLDRDGLATAGLANEGDMHSKADRSEVASLARALRRLQQEFSSVQRKQGDTDWAFFAGKPIRDMRCLSCNTVIDPMVEPPPSHLPTGQFPP